MKPTSIRVCGRPLLQNSRSPTAPIVVGAFYIQHRCSTKSAKKRLDPPPTTFWTIRNMDQSVYRRWTKDALVGRIQELEQQLKEQAKLQISQNDENKSDTKAVISSGTAQSQNAVPALPALDKQGLPMRKAPKEKKKDNPLDPSKYTTRYVAFKFAYLGKNYGGFEYQGSAALPTIEEELWKAFVTSCLIFPKGNPDEVRWEEPEFQYSKCGRTDRGVSAFGQVIALKVRSNRPLPKKPITEAAVEEGTEASTPSEDQQPAEEDTKPEPEFNDFTDEIRYCKILNRLLPKDIRMLAWCPTTPADFSARHSCSERQYRYFFTQPAYAPIPTSLNHPESKEPVKDGWLDIDAMREAAKKYEGLHDFRNFCKIDGSKQLTNFMRRMYESDVVEVKDTATAIPFLKQAEFQPSSGGSTKLQNDGEIYPKVYYFHVRGSAFLWHQIRCMIAVLFSVAQGLEQPSIVDTLFDVEKTPRRPNYVMADEVPLVLWDCIFPEEIQWVYLGEESPLDKHSTHGLVGDLWQAWRGRKMDELLANQLLNLAVEQSDWTKHRDPKAPKHVAMSTKQFEGGDVSRSIGKYIPMMKKKMNSSPEEVNDKTAQKKGYKNGVEYRAALAAKREAAIKAAEEKAKELEAQIDDLDHEIEEEDKKVASS